MSQAPDTRLAYPNQIASLIYDYIEAKPNALLEPNLVTRFERTIALLQRFTIQKEIGEFPVTRKNKQADPLTLKVTQFVSEQVQLYLTGMLGGPSWSQQQRHRFSGGPSACTWFTV